MSALRALLVIFICSFLFQSGYSKRRRFEDGNGIEQATSPPRGWNSYDSFCWTVSEEEFLQNAQLVSNRLHTHGYQYVVVDYLWYRKKVPGANVDSLGFDVIDHWGRMLPDSSRWPSSANGTGFELVAEKVHKMGLKFGIHVMKGISTQAYSANTPILDVTTGKPYEESGRTWYARDIGMKEKPCAWMKNGFMSVNTALGAGKAFLRSLYQQYAFWGVDFVKHDCVFGEDFDLGEISSVSEILSKLSNSIVYSLSPGSGVTPSLAKEVSGLTNMYRITGDDWDSWADVAAHFDVSRDLSAANLIGAKGLKGKSWPDLDMLPFGWLTDPGSNVGPHRKSSLTLDEQRSQMTLWSMAKSPIMFGGDMRKLDDETLALITNPTLLEINAMSSDNKEFPYISSGNSNRGLKRRSELNRWDYSRSATLGLTSCNDVNAKGWSFKAITDVDDRDLGQQICWGEKSREFCLLKRSSLQTSKLHLLETRGTSGTCLSASRNKRPTSKESRWGPFSPCRRDFNQMWELNHNGTLTNAYSGLCASVTTLTGNSDGDGARAWIATGARGEIYVALFNLGRSKARISAKLSDLGSALSKKVNMSSCKGREEWSGKDFGVVKETLYSDVESHGSALIVLKCSSL